MAKDPVCGKEIDEAQARAQTSLTRHGASEVDPNQGTRIFHDGSWIVLLRLGLPHQASWPIPQPTQSG